MNVFRSRQCLSLWRGLVASLVAICGACAHEPTASLQSPQLFEPLDVTPNPTRDLPGTWMAPFTVAGSGERWTLALSDTVVSGTGTWSGEACCSGTVSVTGLLRGDSVHLALVYIQTVPDRGVPPRTAYVDGVVDRPIDLEGIMRDANGTTRPVRYVKSTAVSPAGAALHRLTWWNEGVTRSTRLAADAAKVYALSADHIVSAVDKTVGKTLWQTKLTASFPGVVGSGLGVVAGLVVVGDIDLVALDPQTGKQVWRFVPPVGSTPGFDMFGTDGTTIFANSTTGHVYAIDARTGAARWTAHVVSDSVADIFSPRIANGVVYVRFMRFDAASRVTGGGVSAIDQNSGKVIWSVTPHGDAADQTVALSFDLSPAGALSLASNDSLYVMDRQTGKLTASLPPETFSLTGSVAQPIFDIPVTMTFGNAVVVAAQVGPQVSLSALDATTLARRWSSPFKWSRVALLQSDGGRAYAIASYAGELGVYDMSTGQLAWQVEASDLRPAGERIGAAPVFDDQYVYLGGDQGLYALRKN